MMDMLAGDIQKLSHDLETIREPVTKAAECAEASGERKFRLEDLREQKTLLRTNGTVLQFNKVDHLTGRTPMERFFLRAHNEINGLVALSEDVRAKYQSLLEFFGEDREMPTNDFFGTMNKFIKEFMVSEVQVEREEKARQKEKRRSDAKAKVAATKSIAASQTGGASATENEPMDREACTRSHPLSATLASLRQGSDTPTSRSNDSPTANPLAAVSGARNQTSEITDATVENSTGISTSSAVHPLAAMLAARNQSIEGKGRDQSSPVAHPLEALLATQCETTVVPERGLSLAAPPPDTVPATDLSDSQKERPTECSSPKDDQSSVVHPLAAMLATHGHDPEDPPAVSDNKNDVPVNNNPMEDADEESDGISEAIKGVVVEGDFDSSSRDPPAPRGSESIGAEHAAAEEEDVRSDAAPSTIPIGNQWLAEVLKVTGRPSTER